jgi:hypothetical protein
VNIQFVDAAWVQFKNKISIRLAAVFAAASAAVVAYPSILLGALAYFPEHYRAFAAGGIFVILFAVPTLTALIRQPKLEAKVEAKIEEKQSAAATNN